MNIVIQNLNDQSTRGLSVAYHISKFNTVLWDTNVKSIFDVFYEIEPHLVIVCSPFYKEHSEELRAAQEKYGGLLHVIGMEFDDKFITARPLIPSANIVDSIHKITDKKFQSDISMIVDYLRPNDHSYIKHIVNAVADLNMSFRIYGEIQIDEPNYVGKISKSDIWKIYNNSKVHIDLYGEHYLSPFLFNTLGICELQYRDFDDKWFNCDTVDSLKARLAQVGQEKISYNELRAAILANHTNFDAAASILGCCGLVNESLKVLDSKKDIINEFWIGG